MADVAVLEREDIAMFINAACACTGQSEFYGEDVDQRLSLSFLHAYVVGNYRALYGLCLVAGINHFNQAQIVEYLLRMGAPRSAGLRAQEGALIGASLAKLPPQRVYRMFRRLRRARVNNRRARAVLRGWLATRDLTFDAVKYRALLRSAARHARLKLPDEVSAFLFEGPHSRGEWQTPLFDSFRRSRYDQSAIYELPFTVAEGLAASRGVPRKRFLEKIRGRMTARERERTQKTVAEAGLSSDVDLGKMPLTKACSMVLSLPIAERDERWREGLERSASRVRRGALPGKVRAVFDSSYSARGGAQKRNRPLAVALGVHLILKAGCEDYAATWTSGVLDALKVRPADQTCLADGLLDALESGPELVVLVSDGFENDPPGAAGEVVRLFRKHVDPQGRTAIVHLNPVFDASSYMPRALGSEVPTVGIRDAEELALKLAFARFSAGDLPLSALEAWLESRAGGVL